MQDLNSLPPDSERQQEAVLAVAQHDAFNWGCVSLLGAAPPCSMSAWHLKLLCAVLWVCC
jgi:hypothetical protein